MSIFDSHVMDLTSPYCPEMISRPTRLANTELSLYLLVTNTLNTGKMKKF